MVTYPPGPPHIRRWQVITLARVLSQLVRDPLTFVGQRFAEYGDIYHVDEGGGQHLYVTAHPDMLRELLVTRAKDMQKRGGANDRLVPVLGDGLLTADGEVWRRSRKLMNPSFHRSAIAGYAETMRQHAEQVDWPDGEVVDVSERMMALTLRIVTKALFDHDVGDGTDTVARTMRALHALSDGTALPRWVPTPQSLRARRALRGLHALIEALISDREREGLRDDLLSMLLSVGLERPLVRDQLVTLFLAGHETTSHAMSWTWWLLATHPEVEARLHAELAQVLGGDAPTADTALPYTDAVIAESLRLFPPAFALPRVATVDTEIGGYPIAAGSQVVGFIWHCHRDPRWWGDAETFRPERFLEPTHPRDAYLPFGAGPRMCIGAGFAKLELRVLLATLAQRVRLVAAPGQVVLPRAGVTLSPRGGLPLRVERR
jgi:cytochrome P450